jgi:hypothetical protein
MDALIVIMVGYDWGRQRLGEPGGVPAQGALRGGEHRCREAWQVLGAQHRSPRWPAGFGGQGRAPLAL